MFLKLLIAIIVLTDISNTFAQLVTEHELVKANRIETRLKAKGFIILGHYVGNNQWRKNLGKKLYLIEPLAKHLYKVIPLTDPRLPFFANEIGEKIADYGE